MGNVIRRGTAAVALGAVLSLVACGQGSSTSETDQASTTAASQNATGESTPGGTAGSAPNGTGGGRTGSIDDCLSPGGDVRRMNFGSGAGALSGAIIGRGSTAVAFANQSDQDLCSWVPLAEQLAKQGVMSGLFDYSSIGSPQELATVVDTLREQGASRMVVVGASVGGRAVVTLGSKQGSHLDQIVSLSGEREDSTGSPPDLLSDAKQVRATPVLYVSSKNDGYTLFAEDTRKLFQATPSRGTQLLLVSGNEHGVDLLPNPRVRKAVVAAILGTGRSG